MRTLSLAVLRRTSRITASQSRAGLRPIPPLPINASEVREAADLRVLLLVLLRPFARSATVDAPRPSSAQPVPPRPPPIRSFVEGASKNSWL